MSSEYTCSAQYDTDDTFRSTERAGYVNGGRASVASSAAFEVIGGSLYRRKLEKGFVQYREVLSEDKRLQAIATFHEKGPGKSHHTLEDTYRLVAEHYWWEGSKLKLFY
uniref:Integrase zinc-binding domain-containing protein n=1 Tax=Cyprinus carpio carpio TaxID=630221 RepID=A0A8C1CL37_CYPCA